MSSVLGKVLDWVILLQLFLEISKYELNGVTIFPNLLSPATVLNKVECYHQYY